jgi:hypothetical protein
MFKRIFAHILQYIGRRGVCRLWRHNTLPLATDKTDQYSKDNSFNITNVFSLEFYANHRSFSVTDICL